MNKDKLITDCSGVVDNLVKKYNNHCLDEDLHSVGMVAVVECVNRCIKDKMTDEDQIKARCNTWARNAILDEIYREKVKIIDDEPALDNLEAPDENYTEVLYNVRKSLSPTHKAIFELMLKGFTKNQIIEKLNIKPRTYFYAQNEIKNKILHK